MKSFFIVVLSVVTMTALLPGAFSQGSMDFDETAMDAVDEPSSDYDGQADAYYGGQAPWWSNCLAYQDFTNSSSDGEQVDKWEVHRLHKDKPFTWFVPRNSTDAHATIRKTTRGLPDTKLACSVHLCNHSGIERLETKKQCHTLRGHLGKIGAQGDGKCVKRMKQPTARNFFKNWVKKQTPVVIKGGAKSWPGYEKWNDKYFKSMCKGWYPPVEANKRVINNDRGPFVSKYMTDSRTPKWAGDGWDFCDFIDHYRKPDWQDRLHCIASIDNDYHGNIMRGDMTLAPFMQCPEIADRITHINMWMSSGGTSSSQHFDTQDNIFVQVDGDKEVIIFDPLHSREAYIDYHNKYGLSPVNTEHIDLETWPRYADIPYLTADLEKGDVLYIPENWWHHLRSKKRNISINIDLSLFRFPEVVGRAGLGDNWSLGKVCYEMRSDWSEMVLMLREEMLKFPHRHVKCKEPVGPLPLNSLKILEDDQERSKMELIQGSEL